MTPQLATTTFTTSDGVDDRVHASSGAAAGRAAAGADPFARARSQRLGRRGRAAARRGRDPHLRLPRPRPIGSAGRRASRPSSSRAISRNCSITSAGRAPRSRGCSMGGCVALAFAGLYPDASDRARADRHDGLVRRGRAGDSSRARAEAARDKGMRGLVDFQIDALVLGRIPRQPSGRGEARDRRVFVANDFDCYAASCALLGDADLRPHLPVVPHAGRDRRRRRGLRDAGRDGARSCTRRFRSRR